MSDCWIQVIAVTACVSFMAAIYPLARTDVEIGPSDIVLRWRVLGVVPFARRRIPLRRILDVRPYSRPDWRLPVEFFGGALRPGRRHFAVVIRSRWFGIAYGIVVAPSDGGAGLLAVRARAVAG